MVELGTRRTTERVRVGNSLPTVIRVAFLSRPHFHNVKFSPRLSGFHQFDGIDMGMDLDYSK